MNIRETIKKYLEHCEFIKGLSKKTIKAYRIDLKQYEIYMLGKDFSQKDYIEDYIIQLHQRFKEKTVKRKIASVKAFYHYLEEKEILNNNPFYKIKVKFKETITLPRVIPRSDIEKLFNHMYSIRKKKPTNKYVIRDLAVVEMFFATGIRVYELSNLKKENVNLDTGTICLMGKGGKERYIQIGNQEVLQLLIDYYEMNKIIIEKCGFFFINNRETRFSEQSIRGMINKYSKSVGLTIHVTPHMFRHSVATYLLEEGVDVSYIQRILGHSSIKTTQIYIHVAMRKQAEILKTKHPRNKMNIITAA